MPEETQACLCGGETFDRVIVERPGQPYVTAFLTCRRCGVMFYTPIKPAAWGSEPVVPIAPRPRRP